MHVRNARRAAALAETRPVTYLVFDVLRLDGRDLTREPLSEPPRACWPVSASTTSGGRSPRRTTTGRCCSTPPRSRVSRASSASGSPRATSPACAASLAEVPAPAPHVVRGRRLAPRDRLGQPARRPAGRRADRRRGCSTAAGSAAASPAEVGPLLKELLEPLAARRLPVHRRGAARGRPRHALGRARVLVVDVEYPRAGRTGPPPPAVVPWPPHRPHPRPTFSGRT